jgi:hypothetical protein
MSNWVSPQRDAKQRRPAFHHAEQLEKAPIPPGGDGRRARRSPVLAQRAASEGWGRSGQVPFLLAERAR